MDPNNQNPFGLSLFGKGEREKLRLDPDGTGSSSRSSTEYKSVVRGTRKSRPTNFDRGIETPLKKIPPVKATPSLIRFPGPAADFPSPTQQPQRAKQPSAPAFSRYFSGVNEMKSKYYFRNIAERHLFYKIFHEKVAKHRDIVWFKVAAMSTDKDGVGRADYPHIGYLGNETASFLRSANEHLSVNNVEVFAENIRNNNPIPGTIGLKGRSLDYRLIELEQMNLQEYMLRYERAAKSSGNWNSIVNDLNQLFNDSRLLDQIEEPVHRNAYKYAYSEFRRLFGAGKFFDFRNLDHRIFFGNRLIDYVRK